MTWWHVCLFPLLLGSPVLLCVPAARCLGQASSLSPEWNLRCHLILYSCHHYSGTNTHGHRVCIRHHGYKDSDAQKAPRTVMRMVVSGWEQGKKNGLQCEKSGKIFWRKWPWAGPAKLRRILPGRHEGQNFQSSTMRDTLSWSRE